MIVSIILTTKEKNTSKYRVRTGYGRTTTSVALTSPDKPALIFGAADHAAGLGLERDEEEDEDGSQQVLLNTETPGTTSKAEICITTYQVAASGATCACPGAPRTPRDDCSAPLSSAGRRHPRHEGGRTTETCECV